MLHQTPVLFFQLTAGLQEQNWGKSQAWKNTSVLPSEITRWRHLNEQIYIMDSYVPWWLPTSIYCIIFRFWTQSMQSSVNHFRFSPFISGWQEDVHNMLLDQWRGKTSLMTKFCLFLGQTWHMRESHISISKFTLHNLHLSMSVHQMCPSTNSTSLITDRDTSASTSPRSPIDNSI